MFHLQNYKTMKANVQISAVKKEFKNGQQGWQVKSAVEQAQVAEVATEVAQEVAAEAEQGEPSDKKSEAPEEVSLSDSPIFKQFCDLKKKHPDALLLFRCGDSYKCYEEDAIKAAEILCLTDIVEDDKITVASFPYHALDSYLPRLIRAGHRIAICDQLEAPKPKKQAQMELFTNA